MFPNPRLFGGGEVDIWFDVEKRTSKTELLEQLRLLDGAMIVARWHGSGVALVLLHYDEPSLPRRVELIRKMAGVENVSVRRVPFPSPSYIPSEADWKILQALRDSPRKTYSELSNEVGSTGRTVKRRLERMCQAGTVFAFAELRPRKLEGTIWGCLLVLFDEARRELVDRRIHEKLDDFVWHSYPMLPFQPGDSQAYRYNLFLPSLADAEDIETWTRGLAHVTSARLDLAEDMVVVHETFDAMLRRPLATLPTTEVEADRSSARPWRTQHGINR